MRVWDIDPGYLNDNSLLGEHREVHGIFSVITNGKKGYSRHPETLRWVGCIDALVRRHEVIKEEMDLRGFRHKSPLANAASTIRWPGSFIDPPGGQFEILKGKYIDKKQGRIPLPGKAEGLWAGHKYSVMARDPELGRKIGASVAAGRMGMSDLSGELVHILREKPDSGRLENALLHMWGYISNYSDKKPEAMGYYEMLKEIREKAGTYGVKYLLQSTAIGELGFWCRR